MCCAGTGSAADRVCLGASAARVTISDLIPVGFNSDPVAPTGALGTVVQPASCCSQGTGRCHHLQPCVGASVLDSLGAIRGIPASWTRSAGGVACGPIRGPPCRGRITHLHHRQQRGTGETQLCHVGSQKTGLHKLSLPLRGIEMRRADSSSSNEGTD